MKYEELLALGKSIEAANKIERLLEAVQGQKDSIATDLQSVETKALFDSLPVEVIEEVRTRLKPVTDFTGLLVSDIIRDKVA